MSLDTSIESPSKIELPTQPGETLIDAVLRLHAQAQKEKSTVKGEDTNPQSNKTSDTLPTVTIVDNNNQIQANQKTSAPSAERAKFIDAMAATIRKATKRDQFIDTGTDEKAIHLTLADMSEADRKLLAATYENKYKITIQNEFTREMRGADLDKATSLLNKKDSSDGNAGYIHNLLVEANQTFAGRSKDNIGSVINDKLYSLKAADLAKVNAEYRDTYGKSLHDALMHDVRFDNSDKSMMAILLKGADRLTTADHLALADIALRTEDKEMFQTVMSHVSADARSQFIANGGEARVKDAFGGHWYNALTLGLSGNVSNTDLRHTTDYMKNGELSAATKIKDNTSWMGDNEKAIEDALKNISERERRAYQAVKNGSEHTKEDKEIFNAIRKRIEKAGNDTEEAAWEAMIMYPSSKLCKELLDHRGIFKDSSMDKVARSLESLSKEDFDLLKNNPSFRKDMEHLLDTFSSDSELLRIRDLIDNIQNCKTYDEVQFSGRRAILDAIDDNDSLLWTNEQNVVDAISKMSPHDQDRYRKDETFRTKVDKAAKSALGNGTELEAAKAILNRVMGGENAAMTVIDKMNMLAAKLNTDEGQVIREMQQAFRENPDMRRAVTDPHNDAEKEFAAKFMNALKAALDPSEFQRYAKPLLETGSIALDVQNELDDWALHTNKKNLVQNIVTTSTEQRALLLSKDQSDKKAMELQANVFGELDEKTALFAKTVLEQRAYGPEDRIRSFVLGLGVAKEEALDLMSRLTSEQKQEIFTRYANKYGSNLATDFMGKVKKQERDQVELTARSHTLDASEQLNTILDSHSKSRQGIGKAWVDGIWDGTGFQTDEAHNAMVEAHRKAAAAGEQLSSTDATKFSMRTIETLNNFRESKAKLAEVATDVTITAAAIGGAYFTAGASLSLLAKTAIAGGVGAAIKVGGKSWMNGSDYDWSTKQVAMDGGIGAIYGATAFLGANTLAKSLNVGKAAGIQVSELAHASIARMSEGGAQMLLEGSEKVIQEGMTNIARNMLLRGTSNIPMEAVTALAGQVATEGNKEAVKLALQVTLAQTMKGIAPTTKLAIEYGVPTLAGSMAGGAAGTVRGAADWNSDLPIDENLAHIAKTAGTTAAIGGASAFAFKLGTRAVAVGYDALMHHNADQIVSNPDAYIQSNADDVGIFKKKPVILKAVQAKVPTTIQTLEGPVQANQNDWIMTGVKGEQWPVRPEVFARSYDPVPGAADMFQKKQIQIMAVQINQQMQILDAQGAVKYTGSPQDWLVIGLNGDKYFVKPDIFAATYGAVDQIAQRTALAAENALNAPVTSLLTERAADLGLFRKAPVELKAVQATETMTVQTWEGPVQADPGDWIMTGVKGEQWPIKPEVFSKSYDATDKPGIFKKKPVEVKAIQIAAPMQIYENGALKFTGKATDWLVLNFNGKPYFVDHEVFLQTFNAADDIASKGLKAAQTVPNR